jgi:N-acetylglucosamine-6-phosphate deacetylase
MARTVIVGAKVITEHEISSNRSVILSDGLIDRVTTDYAPQPGDCLIQADGRYLSPGFIDIHTHGGGGHDFMDGTAEAFAGAALAHMAHGTTSLVPTTMACTDEALSRCISAFKAARQLVRAPRLLGLHLEGPYLSPEAAGAQDLRYLRTPDPDHYHKILEQADGSILRWTIAPELEGACLLGIFLAEHGIFPSIGHSNGYYEDALNALGHGFRTVTHLYSSLSSIRRENGLRRLGMIESALLLDEMTVEVIADGRHLPVELLKLIHKTKGDSRMILVTDSMRAAGTDARLSVLGGRAGGLDVVIEDGVAKLPDRSSLAGSIATCDTLLRVMYKQVGLSLPEAVGMLTCNPAKAIGAGHEIGRIAAGYKADLVLFDDEINISRVIIDGNILL